MIHSARDLYQALPRAVQVPVALAARALPVRLRYGSAFTETRRMLQAGWDDYAAERDRRMVRMAEAAQYAPAWRAAFAEAGIPEGPRTPDELSLLPLLTKEQVRERIDSLRSTIVSPEATKWVTTGGTTGNPLGIWIEKDASAIDWAFTVDAWGRAGFRLDERRAVVRGTLFERHGKREIVHFEPIRREMYLSAFDLDSENLPEMCAALEKFRPRYIHGYPSAMEVLGRYYAQTGLQPPRLNALLSVSEAVYPAQRAELQRMFGCRVFSFYGMTEKTAFAAECECSSDLHVDERYGVVELIDRQGRIVTEPGVEGQIVATGLISRAVPLYRYCTGDWAVWSEGECACGSPMKRLASVTGRWPGAQALIGKHGGQISMTALNIHSSAFDRVRRFRFVQDTQGEATLLLLPGDGFTPDDIETLRVEVGGKLAGQIELDMQVVDDLPLTSRGKHLFVDQRIPGLPGA